MLDFFNIISVLPIFKALDYKIIEKIVYENKFKITKYNKNSLIHSEGELCLSLEIILEGIVDIQKLDENGNIITIASFTTGELLGTNLIFSSIPNYPMTVISKTRSSIISFDKNSILEILKHNPPFLSGFLRQISDKTLVLTGKINTIALKTIRNSIVDFLKMEIIFQNSNIINLPFSKKEWAELLGIQRPSLFRELKKLKKEGFIDYNSSKITIKKDLTNIG